MRVHRPLYAGQCLSGIIKSAAAAAAAADDHNHAALSNDQRSAWAGLPSARPGPARPGPAHTAREYSGDIKLCINEFYGLA